MIMEIIDDPLESAIGERIRQLRTARGETLDSLAAASGVSRAMISRIERGEASPTAQLLLRLCTALDLTLSAFFAFQAEGGAPPSPLSRRARQTVWRDPETGYQRRAVSAPDTGARVELVEVEFPAGARIVCPPETGKAGMTQHVWLFSGRLRLTIRDTVHDLEPGDCLHMSITEGHVFENHGPGPAHYAVVLDRGRS